MPQLYHSADRHSGPSVLFSRMAVRYLPFARLGSHPAVLAVLLAIFGWVGAPVAVGVGYAAGMASRAMGSSVSLRSDADLSIAQSHWQLERSEFPLCLDHETSWLLAPDNSAERSASLVEHEILESVCEIYHLYGPQSLDGLWFEPLESSADRDSSDLGRWLERSLAAVMDLSWVDRRGEQFRHGVGACSDLVQGYAKAAPTPVTRAWARLQADLDAIAWVARYPKSQPVAAVKSLGVASAARDSVSSNMAEAGPGSSRPVRGYSIQYTMPAAVLPQVDPSDWLAPQHSRAARPPHLPGSLGGETRDSESAAVPAATGGATTEMPVQRLEPSLYWEVFERQVEEFGALLREWHEQVGPRVVELHRQTEVLTVRVARSHWMVWGDWADRAWRYLSPQLSDGWLGEESLVGLQPEPTASYVGLEPAILGVFHALEQVWAGWQDRTEAWLVRVAELGGLQNSAWERIVLERIDAVRR